MRRITLLCIAGALLSAVGIIAPSLWFLTLPGIALFIYAAWNAPSWRKAALYGFLFGGATAAAGVFWMWDMYPLPVPESMGAPSQFLLIGLIWGITGLCGALGALPAAALIYLSRTNRFAALIAALVWMISEELRMWLFAAYSYAPESLFGPHFSQTAIGYALTESSYLLQLAYPFGIDALNMSAALLGAGFVCAIQAIRERRVDARTLIALISTGCVLVYPLITTHAAATGTPVRVAVLGTMEDSPQTDIDALMQRAAAAQPDLLLLPEGKNSTLLDSPTARRALFGDRDMLVVRAREERRDDTRETPTIRYENTRGEVIASYGKMFLMPQGEYLPSIAQALYPLSGDAHAFAYGESIGARGARGTELSVGHFGPIIAGGLLCSEVISPHLYPALVKDYGANVLLNLSNQAWFHHSHEFYLKMLQIARVHAVATHRYFIEAANDAPSFILDPDGRMVASTSPQQADLIEAAIMLPTTR